MDWLLELAQQADDQENQPADNAEAQPVAPQASAGSPVAASDGGQSEDDNALLDILAEEAFKDPTPAKEGNPKMNPPGSPRTLDAVVCDLCSPSMDNRHACKKPCSRKTDES